MYNYSERFFLMYIVNSLICSARRMRELSEEDGTEKLELAVADVERHSPVTPAQPLFHSPGDM